MAADAESPKDASAITRALNRAVLDALPFADTRDFDDARRGFIGSLPEVEIKTTPGASCGRSATTPSSPARRPRPL